MHVRICSSHGPSIQIRDLAPGDLTWTKNRQRNGGVWAVWLGQTLNVISRFTVANHESWIWLYHLLFAPHSWLRLPSTY